jgi:hypothetical protein
MTGVDLVAVRDLADSLESLLASHPDDEPCTEICTVGAEVRDNVTALAGLVEAQQKKLDAIRELCKSGDGLVPNYIAWLEPLQILTILDGE